MKLLTCWFFLLLLAVADDQIPHGPNKEELHGGIDITTGSGTFTIPLGAQKNKFQYIENGKIKLGVDMESGGSIFYFAELPGDKNLLNHADRGRFIQQSYYGKPDGSVWAKKPWCWNPVQGGDYKGKPAEVEKSVVEEDRLYVKSIPVNWAGGEDFRDCRMEEWITLDDDVAKIRFRFEYRGKDKHPPKHQELPAVFMDYALDKMHYYKGDKPWTGDKLSVEVPGWPNERRTATEEWAAYIGKDGRGMGVYFPGTPEMTTYRHKGPSGPKGGGCSYFAPIQTMTIEPGFIYDYTIYLTIGKPEEIRERFRKIRNTAD